MDNKQPLSIWLDFSSLYDPSSGQADAQYQEFLAAAHHTLPIRLLVEEEQHMRAQQYLRDNHLENVELLPAAAGQELSAIPQIPGQLTLFFSKRYREPMLLHGVCCCTLDFQESLLELQGRSLVEIAREKLLYTAFSGSYEFIIQKDTRQESLFLRDILRRNHICGGRIFDCFCGCGRHDAYLNAYGYAVDGVDISPQQIANARKSSQSLQNRYYACDIRDFQPGAGVYDAAICMWTSFNYLADMADLQRFAAQVARSLKDRGIFILDTKNFPRDTDYKIYTKTLENTEVQITLLTVKKIYGGLQNSRYFYFICDKQTGERQFCVDKEIVRIYSKHDLTEAAFPFFEAKAAYGDYKFTNYDQTRSDRLILVLAKK